MYWADKYPRLNSNNYIAKMTCFHKAKSGGLYQLVRQQRSYLCESLHLRFVLYSLKPWPFLADRQLDLQAFLPHFCLITFSIFIKSTLKELSSSLFKQSFAVAKHITYLEYQRRLPRAISILSLQVSYNEVKRRWTCTTELDQASSVC